MIRPPAVGSNFNRGSKGLGVRFFLSCGALDDFLDSPDYEPPVDGLHLLQQYVRTERPLITRAEFVGGQFLYAVEVDASFRLELCHVGTEVDRLLHGTPNSELSG